jgi:hypothetical protein
MFNLSPHTIPACFPGITRSGIRNWSSTGYNSHSSFEGQVLRLVWDDSEKLISDFGEGWTDDFHIWRMDWNENYIHKLQIKKLLT